MENLKSILSNFYKKNILVIGDLMLDKYTFGHIDRISPEAPVPVLKVDKEEYRPGGAANVALNLAKMSLDSQIYLFGFVGNDNYGKELERILKENSINCYFEKNTLTISKERIIGRTSGQQQHIVRIDKEEINPKKFNSNNMKNLLEIAKHSDRIIISDYAKGAINEELINNLKDYKEKMIVDPKPVNMEMYKEVFLMTPSRYEAFKMANKDNVKDAGNYLRDYLNSNILITLGKEGMALFSKDGNRFQIKTIPEESFEETGAGDTAIAAITLSLNNNSTESIINAAKIANYAAGITVKKIGVYAPSFKELEDKILSLEI